VAVARQAIGPVVLGDALERLHPWALSGATRTGLKSRTGLLEELRSQVAAAGGIMDEAPASEPDRVT
jgi:hypothetical protein